MKYLARVDDKSYEIEINAEDEVIVDGKRLEVDFRSVFGQPVYSLILDGHSYEAYVQPSDAGLNVLLLGRQHVVAVEDERQRRLRESSGGPVATQGEFHLRAPMPGLIVAVPVAVGEQVARGQDMIILESMKMQNELKAPRDGVVSRIRVKPGDSVEHNQSLITLE